MLNLNPTEKEIKTFLETVDKNKDGSVSFEEFGNAFAEKFVRKFTPTELREAFDFFDKDHSGVLSLDEIEEALKRLGFKHSRKGLLSTFRKLDTDNSQSVSFEEFSKFMEGK
jgi:calcium-dependent protein kinase